MAKLRIRNFGPICDGLTENNGWLEFKKVTLIIGEQATGKSTIAKLYAGLSWIEKELAKDENYANRDVEDLFSSKVVDYFGLQEYLKKDTYIEFIGRVYHFVFQNSVFKADRFDENTEFDAPFYPKIMYIPAERNFVSSMYGFNNITHLSKPLLEFWDTFNIASNELKGAIDLPVNNIKIVSKGNPATLYVEGDDYAVELKNSSSGIQSVVPLILVSDYLSDIRSLNTSRLSIEDLKNFRNVLDEVEDARLSIYKKYKDVSDSSDSMLDFKNEILKISKKLYKYNYTHSINIVEEPEQNLYPISQRGALYNLLENINKNGLAESANNELLITSHSPYLINYLTIAIKAHELKYKIDKISKDNPKINRELKNKLARIIPLKSTIDKDEVAIYTTTKGVIEKLPTYMGLPSDENLLNLLLADTNDQFDKLLDIEQEL